MTGPTIHKVSTPHGWVYRVCLNGMCKDHAQDWQAWVFYHQMLNQPANPESLQRDDQRSSFDG